MRVSLLLSLLCSVSAWGSNASAAVTFVHAKALMGASPMIDPPRSSRFSARLSPDGTQVLFPDYYRDGPGYTLVLMNVTTRRQTVVPVGLPRGYETVYTRFNFFNPAGDKLALFSIRQDTSPPVYEVVIFDIPSGTLTPTGITGYAAAMAQFDSTGEHLLVSQHDSYVATASADSFEIEEMLQSGWLHSCSPGSPYCTIFQAPTPERDRTGFRLLNLETKVGNSLPVHEQNTGLDDIASQWTLDGRYLFYFDILAEDTGRLIPGVRVWDVRDSREQGFVPNVICLGPGPSPEVMLMASTDETSRDEMRVYDIPSDTLSPVGPPAARAIHAWRDHVLYAATEDGKESIYLAQMVTTDP